ncbi:alpha/beta fold hydrolase [Streptomyces sp. NPDC020951]|uniref:alpha/beta fold hydrolase n=1 Tax=Streptomyces sp. NPDC020951 TaxID=3365104 RepID=UPI0037B54EFA
MRALSDAPSRSPPTPSETSVRIRSRVLGAPTDYDAGAEFLDQVLVLLRGVVTGVVLDDCGHYPAEEQPTWLVEILEDFLVSNR